MSFHMWRTGKEDGKTLTLNCQPGPATRPAPVWDTYDVSKSPYSYHRMPSKLSDQVLEEILYILLYSVFGILIITKLNQIRNI